MQQLHILLSWIESSRVVTTTRLLVLWTAAFLLCGSQVLLQNHLSQPLPPFPAGATSAYLITAPEGMTEFASRGIFSGESQKYFEEIKNLLPFSSLAAWDIGAVDTLALFENTSGTPSLAIKTTQPEQTITLIENVAHRAHPTIQSIVLQDGTSAKKSIISSRPANLSITLAGDWILLSATNTSFHAIPAWTQPITDRFSIIHIGMTGCQRTRLLPGIFSFIPRFFPSFGHINMQKTTEILEKPTVDTNCAQ